MSKWKKNEIRLTVWMDSECKKPKTLRHGSVVAVQRITLFTKFPNSILIQKAKR